MKQDRPDIDWYANSDMPDGLGDWARSVWSPDRPDMLSLQGREEKGVLFAKVNPG